LENVFVGSTSARAGQKRASFIIAIMDF